MRLIHRVSPVGALAVAALLLGLSVTSASADIGSVAVELDLPALTGWAGNDLTHGGCLVAAQRNGSDQNAGNIGVADVLTDPTNTPDTTAEVDCKITVDGIDAPGTEIDVPADQAGVIANDLPITYDDQNGELQPALCERDISNQFGYASGWSCQPLIEVNVPPQAVSDLLTTVSGTIHDIVDGPLQQVLDGVNGVIDTVTGIINGGVPVVGPCNTVSGQTVCASVTTSTVLKSLVVDAPTSVPTNVAGTISLYRFTLPAGIAFTIPCATLNVNGSPPVDDPCQAAGGVAVGTVTTLSEAPPTPSTSLTSPVATVEICNASLELTVDGIGVNSFPLFEPC